MGQQLIRTGFIEPWAEDRQSFLVLGILGLISLVVGLFLIGKLFLIMIKQYNQHNQVVTSVLVAIGISLITGLLIGGIGQWLYDHSSFTYHHVKNGMWLATSLVQSLIRVTLLYAFICFYKGQFFSLKNRQWQRIMLLLFVCILLIGSIGLLVPRIAELLLYLVDTLLTLGIVYIVMKQ